MDSKAVDSGEIGRLNGWKEIASFLGKGVRTVQRWEREYGLPVHRIGREGGEIVFAFKHEIDAWSRTARSSQPQSPDSPDEANSQALDEQPPAASHRSAAEITPRVFNKTMYLGVALALTAVAVAAILGVNPAMGRAIPEPARWTVDATLLRVFDADGRELWTHSLGFPVAAAQYQETPAHVGMQGVAISDLDGDAVPEVVLAERALTRERSRALIVFNHDGTIRSRIQPMDSVRFGSKEYVGPWAIFRMFVTTNPDATKSVWVAYIHGTDFPTLLLEVDGKSGQEKSRYWSNGYIDSLLVTRWNNRPVVLVGATNNDTRGGSLAVFDYGRVMGSSPAAQAGYRCTSCPPGGPAEFVIFPLRCIGRSIRGTGSVGDLWMDDTGGLHAMVWEGPMDYSAAAWYVLSSDLLVSSAQYVDITRGYHDQKTREGILDHAFGESDQRDLLPLLRWTANGFAPAVPISRLSSK